MSEAVSGTNYDAELGTIDLVCEAIADYDGLKIKAQSAAARRCGQHGHPLLEIGQGSNPGVTGASGANAEFTALPRRLPLGSFDLMYVLRAPFEAPEDVRVAVESCGHVPVPNRANKQLGILVKLYPSLEIELDWKLLGGVFGASFSRKNLGNITGAITTTSKRETFGLNRTDTFEERRSGDQRTRITTVENRKSGLTSVETRGRGIAHPLDWLGDTDDAVRSYSVTDGRTVLEEKELHRYDSNGRIVGLQKLDSPERSVSFLKRRKSAFPKLKMRLGEDPEREIELFQLVESIVDTVEFLKSIFDSLAVIKIGFGIEVSFNALAASIVLAFKREWPEEYTEKKRVYHIGRKVSLTLEGKIFEFDAKLSYGFSIKSSWFRTDVALEILVTVPIELTASSGVALMYPQGQRSIDEVDLNFESKPSIVPRGSAVLFGQGCEVRAEARLTIKADPIVQVDLTGSKELISLESDLIISPLTIVAKLIPADGGPAKSSDPKTILKGKRWERTKLWP